MTTPIQNHLARASLPPPDPGQALVGDLVLRRARVHEFCGPARLTLAAFVMARSAGPVVWLRPGWGTDRLHAAGLQPFADPARLILATAPREDGILWGMEEALRSGAAPLVVAELLTPPGLTPIRRLHLAAEAGAEAARRDGGTAPLGLVLLPGQGGAPGVESRWHLAQAPSRSLLWAEAEAEDWTLTRLRARLAPPATWHLTRSSGQARLEPLAGGDADPPATKA